MVAADTPLRRIVLLNAMIPLPGETPGEWWATTGQEAARIHNDEQAGRSTEFTVETHFLHDVPADVAAAGAGEQRGPADTPFGQPCAFERWPDIPITVLAGRADRMFPLEFQRRVAKERLDLEVDPIPGGHLVALSNPTGLADALVRPAAPAAYRGVSVRPVPS
jgi:pimeloyl-ACP methyl ester carboxylesterase